MDEYIKREDALDAVLFALVGTGHQSKAIYAIRGVPTADVVPKSEEGAECPTCFGTGRIGTTNWLTKNMTKKQIAEEKAQAIAEHEQHIKSDVAREIFEEIDNILYKFAYPSLTAIGTINVINAEGYHLRTRDYAELKKKYTEGEE